MKGVFKPFSYKGISIEFVLNSELCLEELSSDYSSSAPASDRNLNSLAGSPLTAVGRAKVI